MFSLNREDAHALSSDSDRTMSHLPIDDIRESEQVRYEYEDGEQSLADLAESIKAQGLIQPVTVRPHPNGNGYEMVAGGRRYRAARMAGLTHIPAVIRHLSDTEVAAVQMAENIHRKNLTQVEEARRIRQDLDDLGGDTEALLARYQKGVSWLTKRLALLELGPQARRLIDHRLSADVEAIYGVSRIEKRAPEVAAELVDAIAAAPGDGNLREMVLQARTRIAKDRSGAATRKPGARAPFRPRPARMPSPSRKTQPLHTLYTLVIGRKMAAAEAVEQMPPAERETVYAAVDHVFNQARAATDRQATLLELLRRGDLAGGGGLLVLAYLAGCEAETDSTPQEILARITAPEAAREAG